MDLIENYKGVFYDLFPLSTIDTSNRSTNHYSVIIPSDKFADLSRPCKIIGHLKSL